MYWAECQTKVNNSTPIYQKEKAIGLLSPLGIKAP